MKLRYFWEIKEKDKHGEVIEDPTKFTDGLINVLRVDGFKKRWFQWGKNKRLYKTEYFEIKKEGNPEIIEEDLEIKICDGALVELYASNDYYIDPLVTYINSHFTYKKLEVEEFKIQ